MTIFDDFKIVGIPKIVDAYCRECREGLQEVSNGILSTALFCPKCETVYQIKMVRVSDKKISKEFLEQCRKECK